MVVESLSRLKMMTTEMETIKAFERHFYLKVVLSFKLLKLYFIRIIELSDFAQILKQSWENPIENLYSIR